jgi:dsDNA-binding SOS-regulon protein
MSELPTPIADKLYMALGTAVARTWSKLPHDVQHDLFEQAVSSQGEAVRQQLAVFLHDKHSRTSDSLKAHAMPEPDSLGG